ncbi:MAG TPA: MFS transporter [Thermotogota bacterium]|nr:MFS transporter [Thermotogota bacterium]HPJ89555.1 MFS transporter [Thermotogota bacterium]HPR95760.1 MFS transporter [Thermotogota bacterium]
MQNVEKLPFSRKIIYALGQLGWSLASFAVGNALVYFYLPPDTGVKTFPAYFNQGAILFGLTYIGLVFAVGRLFDAFTDPMIAGLSDKSHSEFGRRRKFLAISILPFSLLSVLVFLPPVQGVSIWNIIWLFTTVITFYWFMTMYVTPYFAWLSELGHNSEERLLLSTLISITWAIGFAIGSQIYLFQSMFETAGFSPVVSFQITVAIFAVIGFAFMLLPILFIDEKKYCVQHVSKEGIFEAVVTAFKNRNFLRFIVSDLSYWVALTGISTGLIYYVTILLQQPKETASFLQLVMFGISFVFYVPVNLLAKKFGKKRILMIGFIVYTLTFAFVFGLGKIAFLSIPMQGYVLTFLAAIPLSIFGILPNAVIADIAEADGIRTGNFKAGIFFGARTFMSKMGQMIAGILFPSLLILGMSTENDLGVRLTAVAAICFTVLGGLLLIPYKEKEVLETLAQVEK